MRSSSAPGWRPRPRQVWQSVLAFPTRSRRAGRRGAARQGLRTVSPPTSHWYSACRAATRARCRAPTASGVRRLATLTVRPHARQQPRHLDGGFGRLAPLVAGPATARSSASSAELVVSTPNAIGTRVLDSAAVMPCAHADEMYSKCGVAPRIRQPRQTTPATRPVAAMPPRRAESRRRPAPSALRRRPPPRRPRPAPLRAGEQPLGDEVVEAGDDDADAHLRPFQAALRFSRNAGCLPACRR